MAKRPVFIISDQPPYYIEKNIEFEFFSGFADIQKQKSYQSLHNAFLTGNKDASILEVSSKSTELLGTQLSAFNLLIKTKSEKVYSLESAFQSSKVFENGGPYKDLLDKTPREAKKDIRLRTSGKLISFDYGNRVFPLVPLTYFYNWLYINTLSLYPELAEQLVQYNSFTDIVFNPSKSINCQAKACAVFVSLKKQDLLESALVDKDAFLKIVYGNTPFQDNNTFNQMDLFDKL